MAQSNNLFLQISRIRFHHLAYAILSFRVLIDHDLIETFLLFELSIDDFIFLTNLAHYLPENFLKIYIQLLFVFQVLASHENVNLFHDLVLYGSLILIIRVSLIMLRTLDKNFISVRRLLLLLTLILFAKDGGL